jgi:hypothetical protein
MELRKQQAVKIVAGALLVLLAALVTVFIRDTLNLRSPENSLPGLQVYHRGLDEGEPLPAEHVRRDRYTWRFLFFTPVKGGGLDLEVWSEIKPAPVDPNTPLDLVFSFPPDSVDVSIAAGYSPFVGISGELKAPSNPGIYTYRVDAGWGANRAVQYYFKIRIPSW